MRTALSIAVAASASVLAILATACSAEVTPSTTSSSGNVPKKGDTNTDKDGNDPKDGTSSSSSSSSSSSGSTTTPDDKTPKSDPSGGKCAAEANQEACYNCCAPDPTVFDAEIKAFDDCACGTNGGAGVCKAQCGAWCANPESQPSAACEACLTGATACETAAENACNANPGCTAAYACADASKCNDKPE